MAFLSEEELGDKLIEAGKKLLNPPFSIDELLEQLDSLELYLAKVVQAPPKWMRDALLPTIKALIGNDLLGHTDTDVKISVALCINELMRITAPDTPYDDKHMKECFQLTVTTFRKLSHISSCSYTKAVSILNLVAKVRSCLVMLDLQCDASITEMFQVFLKIIRSHHSLAVFNNMEMIMTLIIEESEDISCELLITLLNSVKTKNLNAFPMTFKLGEKVMNNCAAKLRSYVVKAVESEVINLDDYAWIVSSICKTSRDDPEKNHVSVCKEKMVPRLNAPDVDFPAQTKDAEASANKHPINSLEAFCPNQSKNNGTNNNGVFHNVDMEQEILLEKRGRKPNSVKNLEDGYDHSYNSKEIHDPELPCQQKKIDKEKVFIPQNNGSTTQQIACKNFPSVAPEGHLVSASLKDEVPEPLEISVKTKSGNTVKNIPMYKSKTLKEEGQSDCEEKSMIQSITSLHSKGNSVKSSSDQCSDGKKKRGRPKKVGIEGYDEKKNKSGSRTNSLKEGSLDVTPKKKMKMTRIPGSQEGSITPQTIKRLEERLVGRRIKVWWPQDYKFYEGVVSSYDHDTKRHMVSYADGDQERLRLKDERWMLMGADLLPDKGTDIVGPSHGRSFDMGAEGSTDKSVDNSLIVEKLGKFSESSTANASEKK